MGCVGIREMPCELRPSKGSGGKGEGRHFRQLGITKGSGVSEFMKGNSTNGSVVRDEAGEAAQAAMEADAESVGHSVAEGQPFSVAVLRASLIVPAGLCSVTRKPRACVDTTATETAGCSHGI